MERMEHALCFLPLIPVRRSPEDGAEMTTELLFGDACRVHEYDRTWAHVCNKADGYEGWVTTKMLTPVGAEEYAAYDPLAQPVVASYYAEAVDEASGRHLLLTGGSQLPDYRPDGSFRVGASRYRLLDPRVAAVAPVEESVMDTALRFLGCPYLWGGKDAMGIDCSGLTQVVFRIHGIPLRRNACQQAEQGVLVPFLQDACPGDLAFFDHGDGHISHVGFVAGGGRVLHASGNVHFDLLDSEGIYSVERGFRTHHLRFIKRMG